MSKTQHTAKVTFAVTEYMRYNTSSEMIPASTVDNRGHVSI